ncbi:hypothetical protein [Nostoc sp. 106C]|uniref:hypothetical protein n=1 Tax=Nostoc sp. 106C TaxID=1932667 RepID=UPI000A384B65|nr:hypothetical protein [Nostoc sp. 106C]OUL17856.1 hypothetical protein BV375_35065 [Nostoc sp. 106C]
MAVIKISELRPAGSELFQDSESFLNELSESREVDQVLGGLNTIFTVNANTVNANTVTNVNTIRSIVISA